MSISVFNNFLSEVNFPVAWPETRQKKLPFDSSSSDHVYKSSMQEEVSHFPVMGNLHSGSPNVEESPVAVPFEQLSTQWAEDWNYGSVPVKSENSQMRLSRKQGTRINPDSSMSTSAWHDGSVDKPSASTSGKSDTGMSSRQYFECSYCNNKFTNKASCSRHVKTHRGQFRYSCDVCTQGFMNKLDYEGHMNMHMNLRPYECEICHKTFPYKKHYVRHKKQLHCS